MTYERILFTRDAGVARITLNEPRRLNPLSKAMLEEIHAALDDIERAGVQNKVVVIAHEGRAFSSGHDMKEIAAGDLGDLIGRCNGVFRRLRTLAQPVIAQVDGYATAGGLQLVAACDLAICSTRSVFQTPGGADGSFCTNPAVFLSRVVPRKRAFEMLFTSRFVSADEAVAWGLANQAVPAEELVQTVDALARQLASYSLENFRAGKELFYRQYDMADFDALNYATEVGQVNFQTRSAREGIEAFFAKRKPDFTGL